VRINIKKRRQALVFLILCACFLLLIIRLYNLQILDYPTFKKKAENQHKTLIELKPKRGTIYDKKNRILALDTKTNSVSRLSEITGLQKSFLVDRLYRDKAFIWIKRKINDEEARQIKRAGLEGVALLKETQRSYPNKKLLCHGIGFTDMDNNGLNGVELYYDSYLKGRYGWKSFFRDARQKLIYSYEEYLPAREGYNIVLTVDQVIQHILEEEILNIMRKNRPKTVKILAMNPNTGEILGMASYPYFDLNRYSAMSPEVFKNRCITDSFEPGSVFKIINACAVLEEGVVSLDDKFYCEQGEYKIRKRILHDYHAYGTLTFKEVIEKSSNIGTAKAAEKLGRDKLFDYITEFGFGSVSGIDLPGEENGILRHKDTWSYVDMTTVPMGQGISCTALQLANAISVIANGGLLMRPYVVQYIIDSNGETVKAIGQKVIRRVISEETAAKMRGVLRGVVVSGTGKRAQLDGYTSCGKTGTAQKVGKNGRYSKDKYVASFIGFAPYENPMVTLVVCVDEPKGTHFGGSVSAPAFKNIMQKILQYMEVKQHEG